MIREYLTTVDEHTLAFLKLAYFRDLSDHLAAASRWAYRDMNRTLRFKGLEDESRLNFRQEVLALFRQAFPKLSDGSLSRQDFYDAWHRQLCYQMQAVYVAAGMTFSIGQAQKWLNMTIKYLYMLEPERVDQVFPFLHVPIDKYVFQMVEEVLEIAKPTPLVWSAWDDYDNLYLPYQEAIRQRTGDLPPLRWEFHYWLEAVKASRN